MIIIAIIIGCVLGIIVGMFAPIIPYTYSGYLAIAIIAALDSVFGGIDILVPDNVVIKTKSTSIFGGVENKKEVTNDENKTTIYVNATCIFGGVEIK